MKIFKVSLSLLVIFCFHILFAQSNQKLKLIVGIVVDQMRYDYLVRFEQDYTKGGFNRLTSDGTDFTFAHFNYVPTFTGPGHSSIYTGTTPYYHGIIANDWYDRKSGKTIYCVSDKTAKTLGADDNEGEKSPRKLLATTITDQLKITTNEKAKVIGISIKDRASILPAGHAADAAYWYDKKTGNFISSTYYMKKLPQWVKDFNNKKLPDKYLSKTWTLSKPESSYAQSFPDNSTHEGDEFNEGKTSFPHNFNNINKSKKYSYLPITPFGDDILADFAISTIKNENLGQHKVTDFLAISFSTPDYVGHAYGPHSVEIQDTYIKLDMDIERLINYLDKTVGDGKYLLFLTADHGADENIDYLKNLNVPADNVRSGKVISQIKSFLTKKFGLSNIVEKFINRQIYLNRKLLENNNISLEKVENSIKNYVYENFSQVAFVMTRKELEEMTPSRNTKNLILNGFNYSRSGDVALEYLPNHHVYKGYGTTHGAMYNYDTHVPLVFYGWHVPKQKVNTPVFTVDIAPTIANLIGITEPSSSIGIPIIK